MNREQRDVRAYCRWLTRALTLAVCLLVPARAWAGAPVITQQPTPETVTAGNSASFTVSDSSSCGTITNQWQFNGVNISDNGTYSGTHTGALSIIGAGAAQQGTYRIVLTCVNGGGQTISQPAMLTVNPTSYPGGLPPITDGNLGWSGCNGSSCTVWWDTISGATSLTLTPAGGTPINVTGLTQYTVTPTQSTIYTLTASNAYGTYGENVAVPFGNTTSITSCGTISAPGNYTVSQNLTSNTSGTPCINVQNTSNVVIRCFSGAVIQGSGNTNGGAIEFTNVNNFGVEGCTLQLNTTSPQMNYLIINSSNTGVFWNNTLGSATPPSGVSTQQAYVNSSNYITFWNNHIYDQLSTSNSSGNAATNGLTIVDNFVTNEIGIGESGATVSLQYGGGTQVVGNVIDGGRGAAGNTDDGLFALSETGDLYADNGIQNTRDACFEWSGTLLNSTVYNNSLQNCQFGISNWYGNAGSYGLAGSTISTNRVYSMPSLCVSPTFMSNPTGFSFFYNGSGGGTNVWKNNLFSNNTVTDNSCAQPSQFILNGYGTGWYGGASYTWSLGNNYFSGNSFGTIASPGGSAPQFWYNPSTSSYLGLGVIDGGGNTCSQPPANCNQPYGSGSSCTFETPYPTSGYPITCH